jgi:hypothetical protein
MTLHPKSRVGDEVSYKERTWHVVARTPSDYIPRRHMLVLAEVDTERLTTVWVDNGRIEQ